MIPQSDASIIIYLGQCLSKGELMKTASSNYDKVVINCNDSSLISLNEDFDILAKATEGTAKLTFSYDGSDPDYHYPESFNLTVKVVKIPLNIKVLNIQSNNIILNVFDALDFEIAFEIDEIHKDYTHAWDTLDAMFDSNGISFSHYNDKKSENGSYYTTDHIIAKAGGTTNLTIYSTSDNFTYENYTLKITVNKIPTDITLGGGNSFKVDDTSNINATFHTNSTLNTQTALIYESSDVNVINFISDAGDFKAAGNGTAVLTVRFAGNSTHESSSKTITVTVTKYETATVVKYVEIPASQAFNTKITANSKSPTFSIKLDNDATGYFTVSIDNGRIVKTVPLKDGSASITVNNLEVGSHGITISYSGDGKYAPITQNITSTIKEPVEPASKVTKKPVRIVAKKKTFMAKIKVKKYIITLKSGKVLLKKVKVALNVKGKTYKATTNKKGKAIFKIKNLKKKGIYTAKINLQVTKTTIQQMKTLKLLLKVNDHHL